MNVQIYETRHFGFVPPLGSPVMESPTSGVIKGFVCDVTSTHHQVCLFEPGELPDGTRPIVEELEPFGWAKLLTATLERNPSLRTMWAKIVLMLQNAAPK
jgi:hypothetical protein